MRIKPDKLLNLPNFFSLLRLLMAPAMLLLAWWQQPWWFLAALAFSGFTDVLDGYLARRLNQITELGARLDSWGDFAVYSTMAIGAWLLWPDIVLQNKAWFIMIIASFTVPVIIGLIKFHSLTSYHTWSVKIAVLLTFIGYVLLFTGVSNWPFQLAAVVCLLAASEEIGITLLMRHQYVDIRSIKQAWRYHRSLR